MNNDSTLPKTGYLAFDALSMKAFLKQRLVDNGVFTDQLYEGSNLSQIIDVFAMTFQNLIFYMNKTGAEGLFSDAQIYENLNRITKALGYNPIGAQTALLPYKMKAPDLIKNKTYIIPRYSKISVGNMSFSINSDIIFSPIETDKDGYLNGISTAKVLYEGEFEEYQTYVANGDDYELVELNPGENIIIDHFNINVFVYIESEKKWVEAERTSSLYLNNASDNAYECRLNESGYYELKFGNDICGRKLATGDKVQIYYLKSSGRIDGVGAHEIDGANFIPYQSDRYTEIMKDVRKDRGLIETEITNANTGFLEVFNETASTYYSPEEDVSSIRTNAPSNFRSQYRLVTSDDFKSFVKMNYSNIIHSVFVMNNWEYIRTYLKYLHSVGLSKPSSDTRMALGQFMFSDSCNFNNVYIFAVPKIIQTNIGYEYISDELKSMMIQEMQPYKTLTCEPVIIDPIYMAFEFGIPEPGEKPKKEDAEFTALEIIKSPTSHRSSSSIKEEVIKKIKDFFMSKNNILGETVEISSLAQEITSIDGILSFNTVRTYKDKKIKTSGLSFIIYNNTYPEICEVATSNKTLDGFQFPYYNNIMNIENHINCTNDTSLYNTIEY